VPQNRPRTTAPHGRRGYRTARSHPCLTGRLTDTFIPAPARSPAQRFLREARAKVWANSIALNHARRQGPPAYATRLAQLEELSAAKVADLRAPGQVLLKLAVTGFGVRLPG
jgi:hypothetical protein